MASRTILEIAIEAAERDATAPAPTTLFGTNNRIAKILRGAAKDTIREYLARTGWQGTSEFQSTWVLALRAGRYAYQMPPDYLRMIPGTEQRDGWPMGLVGPTDPRVWAAWLYGGQATAYPAGWRIKGNVLWIDPTPAADELVTIEYISRYPVVSAIQDGDYNIATSPMESVAPIAPRDGWVDLDGTDVIDQGTAGKWGDATTGWDVATWGTEPEEVLKRLLPDTTIEPLPQVRRAEFTADTDYAAFDDDFPLSMGMTFRLRRALGMPYTEHAAEYEALLESKAATDAGGPRDIHLGTGDDGCDVLPLGGNKWMLS